MGKVNICGIPYTIKLVQDEFDAVAHHYGQANLSKAEFVINTNCNIHIQEETLRHEILHAIFTHIGREDLSNDEQLVQSLANAIYQTFDVRIDDSEETQPENDI